MGDFSPRKHHGNGLTSRHQLCSQANNLLKKFYKHLTSSREFDIIYLDNKKETFLEKKHGNEISQ